MPATVAPYLYYEDARAAVEWLCRAFGFEQAIVFEGEGGRVEHAELRLGDGTVMLGQPGRDYRSPNNRDGGTAGVHVYVDDVDAHFEQARAAGAVIHNEPTDQPYGDRRYDCDDLEGHNWFFATPISPPASGAEKATEQTTS